MAEPEVKNSPLQLAFYHLCKNICLLYFKLGWRLHVTGVENVPATGGSILAANHRSYADPPLVGVSISRAVHFLAKEELFSFKPFGWLIGSLNAHPLKRSGGDIVALKAAMRILESGNTVIVFPEGRRNQSQTLAKAKAGVGLLARMSGCPVVPVYVHNSAEMVYFKKISVHFGKPILPDKYESNQALADEVMAQIALMKQKVLNAGG